MFVVVVFLSGSNSFFGDFIVRVGVLPFLKATLPVIAFEYLSSQ